MRFHDEILVVEVLYEGKIKSEGAVRGRFALDHADAAKSLAAKLTEDTGVAHAIITMTGESGLAFLDLGDAIERLSERVETGEEIPPPPKTNRGVARRFGRVWPVQAAENLKQIATHASISALHDAFVGQTGIVVSPGPSLDKNIGELRRLQRKSVIFATSQTLGALYEEGVTPTFAVCADSQEMMLNHFDLPEEFLSKITLILSAVSHPSLFELPMKTFVTYPGNGPADEWVYTPLPDKPALLSGGGSVACIGTSAAINSGCSPVVLVGQDLSYPDGRHYSKYVGCIDGDVKGLRVINEGGVYRYDVPEDHISFGLRWRETLLDGYYGGKVGTSRLMAEFHRWFETMAFDLIGQNELINATEGGAKIKGWKERKLSSIDGNEIGELDLRLSDQEKADRWARTKSFAEFLISKMEDCKEGAEDGDVGRVVEDLKYLPMLSVPYQDPIAEALVAEDPKAALENMMALAETASVLILPVLREVVND